MAEYEILIEECIRTRLTSNDVKEPLVMSRLARAFGLQDATQAGIGLAKTLAMVLPAFAIVFQVSTTFWTIFIAESLGGGDYLAGITIVSFLVVIQLIVQTIFDYPTGALGDHIGQRWVIASALFCYAIAFWITSTLTYTTEFIVYVAIYGLMGFGASQESGAFHAWFDNNYRVAMPQDKDRKAYGVFWGKVGFIWQISSTLVLIPGSIIATIFFRQLVFQIQAIACILLAFVVLSIIKDLPGAREVSESKSFKEYAGLMKDGVRFLFSSRFVSLVLFGEVFLWAIGTVWWQIVLFPLYFAYLFNDVTVSSFRTLVFFPEAFGQERSGVIAQRFDPVKWTPRLRFFQFLGVVFNILLAAIIFAMPPPTEAVDIIGLYIFDVPIIEMPVQSVLPIVLLFIIFIITDLIGGIANILNQRVFLDVVPNRIRNSIYSLQPTIAMMMAIPFILLFGWLLPLHGFPTTFMLMAIVTLFGTLLIVQGFRNPIPQAELVVPAEEEAIEIVGDLEVT
ncbi:MAG: MFS transporter [Candidatus Thorarchaeota archaeon]